MLGYLIHTFPLYSATFITGELCLMQALGEQIRLFSVQRPNPDEYPPEFAHYARETAYIFPMNPLNFVLRHLVALSTHPIRYCRTLGAALTWGNLSLRNRLRTLFHFAEAVYLYPEVRKAGCTHLHVHFLSGSASVALFMHQLFGLPYSMTAHGTDIFVEKVLLEEKMAYARFTRVGTSFNRNYLAEFSLESDTGRIEVIPFGVDPACFDEAAHPVCQTVSPIQVLNVGRLVWQKAQHLLVDAAASVRGSAPKFHVTIIGEGAERGRLEQLIRQHGIEGTVELAGAKSEAEVRAAYRQAQLFVMSSVSEGFGLVLLEAMAAGLAVVAPRLHGIPEIVTDGVTGRLFESGNAQDLGRILKELFNDTAQRIRLGEAAFVEARHHSNADAVCKFREVLNSYIGLGVTHSQRTEEQCS